MKISAVKYYFIPLAVVLAIGLISGRIKTISFTGNFLNGLIYSSYGILAGGISLVISLIFQPLENYSPSVGNLACFFATCILTGVFEEIMCRGLIQGSLTEAFENQGRSPIGAILLSSMIFALAHFANLLDAPQLLLATITQVIYTFALGMLLGLAYYKSKSLNAVITVHALFNFLGGFTRIFSEPLASSQLEKQDISPLSAAIQLAIIFPGILITSKIYKRGNKGGEKI